MFAGSEDGQAYVWNSETGSVKRGVRGRGREGEFTNSCDLISFY